jgi:hypothetical protein
MTAHRFAKRSIVGVGAATASLLALATGCASNPGTLPAVTFPSATTPQLYQISVPPRPSYTGYAPPLGVVTTTISDVSSNVTMSFPMSWVTFTVTTKNTSDFSFVNIESLIVFGQCTCNPQDYNLAPHTILQYLDPTTNAWKSITSAVMNSKQQYKSQSQTGPMNLGPDKTVTIQYRMELANTVKEKGLVPGPGSLNVFLLQLPARTRLSASEAADAILPLTYQVG